MGVIHNRKIHIQDSLYTEAPLYYYVLYKNNANLYESSTVDTAWRRDFLILWNINSNTQNCLCLIMNIIMEI